MTTSVTRSSFVIQHQTCKTKTKTKTDFFLVSDRSCPKTDGLRPHYVRCVVGFLHYVDSEVYVSALTEETVWPKPLVVSVNTMNTVLIRRVNRARASIMNISCYKATHGLKSTRDLSHFAGCSSSLPVARAHAQSASCTRVANVWLSASPWRLSVLRVHAAHCRRCWPRQSRKLTTLISLQDGSVLRERERVRAPRSRGFLCMPRQRRTTHTPPSSASQTPFYELIMFSSKRVCPSPRSVTPSCTYRPSSWWPLRSTSLMNQFVPTTPFDRSAQLVPNASFRRCSSRRCRWRLKIRCIMLLFFCKMLKKEVSNLWRTV